MYNFVLWVCVSIENYGRRRKKGGDEEAKNRPGNETAGGIRTKFTRDWPRDVFRERHAVRYVQQKEEGLIQIIHNFYNGRIACI